MKEKSDSDVLAEQLAHCRDEVRRANLELGKAKAWARDALNCLRNEWDHWEPDVDGAVYSLGLILDIDRPSKKE
ncbi:MAG: hypothetical protein M3N32_07830 [Actinomycetota bacterium]|nr:hypothetical protein [Actinomycetota bacterium]